MEGYLVCWAENNDVILECDTIEEARETVRKLEATDIAAGKFEPFTYKIRGIEEVEGDCEGVATCWRYAVDIEGGLMQ